MLSEKVMKDVEWTLDRSAPKQIHGFDRAKYRESVPEALLEIWRRVGIATFCKGAYRTVDPAELASLLANVFPEGAPLNHGDLTPYILTAFGSVLCWHQRYGVVNIELPIARCIVRKHPSVTAAKPPDDIQMYMSFPIAQEDADDLGDFSQAKKQLGTLSFGEIYAYVPALPLGGTARTARVEKVQADVHLDFLSQLRPIDIFTMVKQEQGYQLVPFQP